MLNLDIVTKKKIFDSFKIRKGECNPQQPLYFKLLGRKKKIEKRLVCRKLGCNYCLLFQAILMG